MTLGAWALRFEAATPWAEGGPGARRARFLFATVVAVIVVGVLWVRPLADGDTGEYLLMTESLFQHGTPDLRPADVQSLARLDRRAGFGLNYAPAFLGYYEDSAGRWYSYHFWSYSLTALPTRLLLGLAPGQGIRALPLTNAVFFLFALHRVLFWLPFSRDVRIGLFLLVLVSPLLWFLHWPHPEAMTASFVLLSLVGHYRGLRRASIAWAALASLQAPPLIVLVGLFWAWGCWAERNLSGIVGASLAALPALAAPVFFLWHFGTASVIGREATSLDNLSVARALELFLDLNLGLLPYMPVTLLLFAVAAGGALLRVRKEPFEVALLAALALMALVSTVTRNWNHGTVGPSRYALWLSPIVVMSAARLGGRPGRAWALRGLVALAVLTQAVVVVAKGGFAAEPDHLDHSYAARFVLAHAPALYNPSFPIFVTRTTHDVVETAGVGPYVYAVGGSCRKALARSRPRHLKELRERCGSVPSAYEGWFTAAGAEEWRYIDY